MTIRRFRSSMKICAAMLAIACFLTFGPGGVSTVLAADPPAGEAWETWPKKPEGAGAAGGAGGSKTTSGISGGTWGWIAGGTAAVILVGVLAFSGGGGGGNGNSPAVCPQ